MSLKNVPVTTTRVESPDAKPMVFTRITRPAVFPYRGNSAVSMRAGDVEAIWYPASSSAPATKSLALSFTNGRTTLIDRCRGALAAFGSGVVVSTGAVAAVPKLDCAMACDDAIVTNSAYASEGTSGGPCGWGRYNATLLMPRQEPALFREAAPRSAVGVLAIWQCHESQPSRLPQTAGCTSSTIGTTAGGCTTSPTDRRTPRRSSAESCRSATIGRVRGTSLARAASSGATSSTGTSLGVSPSTC